MITMRTAQPGFSLTEIIIAIMIVGFMVAGTIGLFSWVGQAKRKSTESMLRTLSLAISQYYANVHNYPTALQDLVNAPAGVKGWQGPYLDKEITLDSWNNDLQYIVKGKGQKPPYELYSYGANGEGSPESEWIRAEKL